MPDFWNSGPKRYFWSGLEGSFGLVLVHHYFNLEHRTTYYKAKASKLNDLIKIQSHLDSTRYVLSISFITVVWWLQAGVKGRGGTAAAILLSCRSVTD